MLNFRVLTPAVVAAIAAACSTTPLQPKAPAARSVEGAWVLAVQGPMGVRDSDAVFMQNGEQLTGTVLTRRGEVPLVGTVKGEEIRFRMNVSARGQQIDVDYAGTVAEDTMGGTVQFGSFGDGTWTGKRKAQEK